MLGTRGWADEGARVVGVRPVGKVGEVEGVLVTRPTPPPLLLPAVVGGVEIVELAEVVVGAITMGRGSASGRTEAEPPDIAGVLSLQNRFSVSKEGGLLCTR